MAGFQHAIAGGQGNLVTPALQSPNFNLATRTGWAVMRNGDAYFFNVTATGDVTATVVIAEGPGAGTFVYDGAAALNTLVVSIASAAGVDQWGNQYSGPGISVSAPGVAGGKNEIQIRPDKNAVLIYAS
jgi:hypothetical protein